MTSRVLIAATLLLLAGCAVTPPAPPTRAPFERCMDEVGKMFYYTADRVRAADWCAKNDNGGIK